MAAFVAGVMILFLNQGLIADPFALIAIAMALALGVGALCVSPTG